MKKLFIFLMLTFALTFGQQVSESSIENHFGSSYTYIDSAGTKWLVSSDTVANQYEGSLIISNGGGDVTVVGKVENVSGTVDVLIEIGLDYGVEYGIDWYEIAHLTGTDVWKFDFLAQAWGGISVCRKYKIRITETGTQSNKYGMRVLSFKWK